MRARVIQAHVFPKRGEDGQVGTERMVQVKTPAKVNLYLEVIGRRADGYHDIRSLVVPVALWDGLTLTAQEEGIALILARTDGVDAAELAALPPGGNLAVRAAAALREATGYRGGARIVLEKHIPIGGGLGGGSADAAGVLAGLNALWDTGLNGDALAALGAGLGCDVPALVYGGLVLMEGRGERITRAPVRAAALHMVLVNPGFAVSTRDIYARYRAPLTSTAPGSINLISALEGGNVSAVGRGLYNGLQDTVFRKYPLIEQTADALREAGAIGVVLCGSGASVLGLARDRADARRIAASVRSRSDMSVWVQAVETLPDGVMVAHGPLEARV
jgi:4-diphosphocytidyl-2-C-methyl-D-erythritol kinase